MEIEHLTIKDFVLLPIGSGKTLDDYLIDEIKLGSLYSKIKDAGKLKGHWPPQPNELKQLEEFVDAVERVEKRSGVKFSHKILLAGSEKGIFVNDRQDIIINFSAFTGKSPLGKDEIEAMLLHEAGHVKNKDLEQRVNIAVLAELTGCISSLSEFYKDEPDKFAHVVRSKYGSPEEFESVLTRIINSVGDSLNVLESHPDYNGITDNKMVDLLTRNSDISSRMLSVKLPDGKEMAVFEKLAEAFMMQSKKYKDVVRKNMEIMGVNFNEYLSSILSSNDECSPILPQDKKILDDVNDKIFVPLKKRHDALVNFLGAHSCATEYRADDFAIINATNPEIYIKCFDNPKVNLQQNESQLSAQMEGFKPVNFVKYITHPDDSYRADRTKRLIRRIKTAKEMCGKVDVNAVVSAVNKELLAGQKSVSSTNLPTH